MRRVVIGGRNRVLAPDQTRFISGAALAGDFEAYRTDLDAADLIIWAWYALDDHNRPDLESTLRGTEAILNNIRKHPRPLIFLSTDAVFAGSEGAYGEGDAPRPQTDYARIKLAQEKLMADFPRLRFTTFGPSYNPARPLLIEMIAQGLIAVDRPQQFFSPISTSSLDRTITAIAVSNAEPRVYHLTSERVSKADCFDRISRAIGVPLPRTRTVDVTPLDLSLTSTTHRFSLSDEIEIAAAQWRRLRAPNSPAQTA